MCELNAHMNLRNKMSSRGNRDYKVKTPGTEITVIVQILAGTNNRESKESKYSAYSRKDTHKHDI